MQISKLHGRRALQYLRKVSTLSAGPARTHSARGRHTAWRRSTRWGCTCWRPATWRCATFAALRNYLPGHFAGRLVHFLPSLEWVNSADQPLRWLSCARQAIEYYGPNGCELDVMLLEPYARVFAELFAKAQGTPCPLAN